MLREYSNKTVGARFLITSDVPGELAAEGSFMMFIWNDEPTSLSLIVDDRELVLHPNQITCVTYLQFVSIKDAGRKVKTLAFNREFYCVHTNDSEVSCNGLLFFGSNYTPILTIDEKETHRLQTLFSVLEEEFQVNDANQEEMLRILLKRFIIRCTRLARKQLLNNPESNSDVDLIRKFNYLVEEHFRHKKTVSEYAEMMYKSPKTLTNVFSKYSEESPLQIIHNRVIMEAKRMLYYTEKSSKEIGYELGYADPAQFSKLFKNNTGMTTSEFRQTKENMTFGQN